MKCAPNSHYELCADTCTLTCSALSTAPQCPDTCAEGCQCDSGFLSDGQACVPIQKCGCYHDGIYYEVGTWSSPTGLQPHPGPLPNAHQSHSLCTWPPERPSHPLLLHNPWPHCGPACPLLPGSLPALSFAPFDRCLHGSGKDLCKYNCGSCNFKPSPDSSGQVLALSCQRLTPLLPSPALTVTPFPLIRTCLSEVCLSQSTASSVAGGGGLSVGLI